MKKGTCPKCEAPAVYRKRGVEAYIAGEEKLPDVGRAWRKVFK